MSSSEILIKNGLFLETFGFYLENLIPIKESSDGCDYYSNHSKIDLYIYSHKEKKWAFIPNGVHMNVYQLL